MASMCAISYSYHSRKHIFDSEFCHEKYQNRTILIDCFQMYQRCSLDDVVLQNNKIAAQISNTLLKSVLVNLARSPNSFVLLRK